MCYKNAFGEINEDVIIYKKHNEQQSVSLKNLVKVRYVKRQKMHINYILFLLSILLIVFNNNNFSNSIYLFLLLISIILIAISFYFRSFDYKFIIIKKNYLTEVKVSKELSLDVKELTYKINEIIARNQFNELFKSQETEYFNLEKSYFKSIPYMSYKKQNVLVNY